MHATFPVYSNELFAVAEYFRLEPADLLGRLKNRRIATARAVFGHIMRRRGLTYPQIGRLLLKDHTTMLHALQKRPLSIIGPEVEAVERMLKGDEA